MQIVYIPSESMSVQGKKDEIYKKSHVNFSEWLQLAKSWGNFISDRIIIWRLQNISIIFTKRFNLSLCHTQFLPA